MSQNLQAGVNLDTHGLRGRRVNENNRYRKGGCHLYI